MPGRRAFPATVGVGLCLICAGCLPEKLTGKGDEEPRQIPPEIAGTVGEYASVVGGGSLLLDGHGLMVGLGKNGSPEVPPQLRKYLVEYMLKQKVGSALGGAAGVTPSDMIADSDTAVVRLVGVVPPGAPQGWSFDVSVAALSRTGTRSLDGGVLYPFPLYLAGGEGTPPTSGARAWAMAEGSVFVNPFLDPGNPADAARLREGRLIGGGKVLQARPLRLILREPDYARCNLIQRRINQRFGQPERIANAKNPATIELEVPAAYVDDYEHFLQLVTHLPLQAEPARWEARARDVAEQMTRPGANHEGLALVWEAMGNQVVAVCRTLYASTNVSAAFYSARTGLRLKDDLAGDVLIRFATMARSPFQVPAVQELGRHSELIRSIPSLRQLVDDESELVRIAAYEALVRLGDSSLITRVHVGDEFKLDLVTSRRSYVIYATQSGERKIALFGRDMSVARRLFFDMPDDLVIIADKVVDVDEQGEAVDPTKLTEEQRKKARKESRLMVFRAIPRAGRISDPFYTDFLVRSLVQVLGSRAERDTTSPLATLRKVKGLGLTYGQVVAVLYRMCELDKDIPARFVLQPPPGTERIYRGTATVGRPDMPGE